MRVLYIIPTIGCGGAEILLTNMTIELAKRGHIIKIISLNEHHETFVNLPNKALLLSLSIIEILKSNVPISLLKGWGENSRELQTILDGFQPDVVHTHLFESEIVSRSCYYPKAKWFSHCHNNIPQFNNFSFRILFNRDLFIQFLEKWYLINKYRMNGGNTFIAISKSTLKYFQERLPNDLNNVHLLANAIDTQRFVNKKIDSKSGVLKLISVGNLLDNKNHKFLLNVVSILNHRGVNCSITILGFGETESYLRQQVKQLGIGKLVNLPGSVENVEDYLKDASIYVHSALKEAFGLTLIEAMAAGLPVVTLDGKGNRDLIIQEKNGYMLFDENPENFANKILAIWNDKIKYQEMSKFAQEYAQQYDIKPYTDKLLELYQNAIDSK